MPARVTLRDIAQNIGCSIATVSRALRERSEIPPETRKRVRDAAEALHYVPDPALSALVDHRRGLRQRPYTETLALISPEFSWTETKQLPYRSFLIETLRAQARGIGYKLDFFHVPAGAQREQEETSRVLRRRGIRGLIFLPSSPPAETFAFSWEYFAAVRLFRPPLGLRITSVDVDAYQGMHLVVSHFQASGCRRPGLVMPKLVARYQENEWERQLRGFAAEHGNFEPAGTFEFEHDFRTETERAALLQWLKARRPDVLIAFDAPTVASALAAVGWQVPKRIGLIDLDHDNELSSEIELAGLRRSRKSISQTAVDHLHSLLLTHSLGLPEYPATVKVAYEWIDGPSLHTKAGK